MTDARTWIDAQLAALDLHLAGPIETIQDRPWSTVMRVPTEHGDLFFKASGPSLRHEAAVASFLARRSPDVVPAPLAVDLERGWMLMADAGNRLRELVEAEHDVSRWLDVLPAYARLQVDLAGAATELLALGVPDMRLAVLPERFETLLRSTSSTSSMPSMPGPPTRCAGCATPSRALRRCARSWPPTGSPRRSSTTT